MESKFKHLEFIQLTITRLSANSFFIKGWAVTLVVALLVLFEKADSQMFFYITFLPVLVFWILDGYYLSKEREFRKLYDVVRKQPAGKIDFSLNTEKFSNRGSWLKTMFSVTLIMFYVPFLILINSLVYLIYHAKNLF